jgi:hypothetical protein
MSGELFAVVERNGVAAVLTEGSGLSLSYFNHYLSSFKNLQKLRGQVFHYHILTIIFLHSKADQL